MVDAIMRCPFPDPALRARRLGGALLIAVLCMGCDASAALAEGVSIGGNIGGTGGSAGGSIGGNIAPSSPPKQKASRAPRARVKRARPERVPVARRPQRAARYESAPRRERAGGGGSFEGLWSLSTSSSCAGTGTGSFRVSGSRLYAQNASGSVSASGSVHSVESFNGLRSVYTGRLSQNSGGGSYRRQDGCTGRWSAYRSG